MCKKKLWLYIADLDDYRNDFTIPVISWMAAEKDIELECYLESRRDGRLFAKSGSTVIGGNHFSHFNYLCNKFQLSLIVLGESHIFQSSAACFQLTEIVKSAEPFQIFLKLGLKEECPIILLSEKFCKSDYSTYIFPEIFFRKAIACPISQYNLNENCDRTSLLFAFHDEIIDDAYHAQIVDMVRPDDSVGSFSKRLTLRWLSRLKGVAFGDKEAIRSQIPTLCRKRYAALFENIIPTAAIGIKDDPYVEQFSPIAEDVARIARSLGNPIIIGRQTGDGDIMEWSKQGVCIEIIDPNRPTFPIIETVEHFWAIKEDNKRSIYEEEPTDELLDKWIKEKRILTTIMIHSGEMAHNEAIANLFELLILKNFKMGVGVHVARYKTFPQVFELLSIADRYGGVLGYAEPVLHSGGRGVLAESLCPPELLTEHCIQAIKEIKNICGEANIPKGYMSFMDSDFASFRETNVNIYKAVEKAGLSYYISNSKPGRNQILYDSDRMIALNQTTRKLYWGSPFVRSSTFDDVRETSPLIAPGWLITTIDSPVIAFNPYIWEKGSRFLELLEYMKNGDNFINVTPSVISRYARRLMALKVVPT